MNRIDRLFKEKQGNILSVYFTAGYPLADSTAGIIRSLAQSGVDMVEIGMPFSDPMADGPVIQKSNEAALRNGMNIRLLFSQLSELRSEVDIPVLLMGYLNPVLQFGVENFCTACWATRNLFSNSNARSISPSASTTSWAARPAAQLTGCPPKVVICPKMG